MFVEQQCCSIGMDLKWYAGNRNTAKLEHETHPCGIQTHHMVTASYAMLVLSP